MVRRLVPCVMIAALATGCHASAPGTVGPRVAALTPSSQSAIRTIAEGTFTLPSTLVSVGTGSLVSVGTGSLVSVGTAQFRVQALGLAPEVGVASAQIALQGTQGEDVGLNPTYTDTQGRFAITGTLGAGVYRIAATINGACYLTLVASRLNEVASAPVDVATTLVASRLIRASGKQDLTVLPADSYAAAVQAVSQALATDGLPAGWTPDQAAGTMAQLAQAHPSVAQAENRLDVDVTTLEQRAGELQFKLQNVASQLGVPAASLNGDLDAALSENPSASDEQITQQVETSHQSADSGSASGGTDGKSAPTTAPTASPATTAPASATPTPSASAVPSSTPSAAASATPAPTATPTTAPTATVAPTVAPTATPAPSATAAPTPAPAFAPTIAPTIAPTPTPAPSAYPTAHFGFPGGLFGGSAIPTTAPTPTPTPALSMKDNGQGNKGQDNGLHLGQTKQNGFGTM